MTFFKREEGGITMEAALIVPFFAVFAAALFTMIRIVSVESALQHAVSETTGEIATHMYPVRLLYEEAKDRAAGSPVGIRIGQMIDSVKRAQDSVETAERFVDNYSRYIPDSLVALMEWEKTRRELLERDGAEQAGEWAESVTDPLLNRIFVPALLRYGDETMLKADRLSVERVRFSGFDERGAALFGIEVAYELKLPIPFVRKTIHLRKRSVERMWLGA